MNTQHLQFNQPSAFNYGNFSLKELGIQVFK